MTRNDAPPPPDALTTPGSTPGGDAAACEVVISNPLGLHTRPATLMAKATLDSACEVKVTCLDTGEAAQGNSILSLLTLGAPKGARLRVEVAGPGAGTLLSKLKGLFESGFGEPPQA